MMASWYQSGSVALPGRFTIGAGGSSSCEVVEVALGAHSAAHPKQVGREERGLELDEVSGALPEEAAAGEQIVGLEGLVGRQAKALEVQLHCAGLPVERIEVHHHDDGVALVRRLAVAEQEGVVG